MNKYLINILFLLCFFSISYSQNEGNEYDYLLENHISSPTNYINQPFDVLHYDATLDLTKAPNRDAKGICEITVFWKEKISDNKFFFHLRGLKVDSAFYEDVKVIAEPVETPSSPIYHYEIAPPQEIDKDTVLIKIYYSGRMTAEPVTSYGSWGGVHSYSDILFSIGVGIYNNYVGTTQHWLPCYDHPSDKATFKFRFIVRAGKKVASNGNLRVLYLDNGTDIYEYSSDIPCATYLMTFAVADFIEKNYTFGQIPVVLYYLPKDSIYSRHSFAKLNDMIETFQELLGPYPFEKVGYVVTPIGSMEHQTMISMDDDVIKSYYQNNDTICATVAHELSHQWFGDFITPYDYRDAWLNEAFATYCENLWVEKNQGFSAYLDYLSDQIDTYFKTVINYEGTLPLYNFQKIYTKSNYPWTIYIKGSAVVALLRYHLGDSLFFMFLKDHLQRFAYKNASTEDLIESLAISTKLDFKWFFDQWVYNSGYPSIKVFYHRQFNDPSLRIVQSGNNIYKNLPVEITFILQDGTKVSKVFETSNQDSVFQDGVPFADSILVNHGDHIRTLMKAEEVIITDVVEHNINTDNFDFYIYPNPSNNYITVNLNKNISKVSFQIFDFLGREVYKDNYHFSADVNTFHINIESLYNGIYTLKIGIEEKYFVKQFIIQRD